MLTKKYVIIAIIVLFTTPLKLRCQDKQSLQKRIQNILQDTALQYASVAFSAFNLSDSVALINYNGNKSLVPASIQKVITTGVALETLDSNFRFSTRIGYRGNIQNGVLNGDLYVIGSGDPTIGSVYFNSKKGRFDFISQWITLIKNAGIKSVKGRLIVDISHFEDWPVVSTWTYEDLGNYYGAGIYGFMFNDNICELHFSSPAKFGEATSLKYIYPNVSGLQIDNRVKSGKGGDNAYVFMTPTSDRMIVRGDITAGKPDFVVKASIPNPPALFAHIFAQALDSAGISQTVSPFVSQTAADTSLFNDIAIIQSEKLSKIIEQTNFNSINLFAETLIKEIGWSKKGNGSVQDGLVSVYEFCRDRKINYRGIELVDGSGLTRFNMMNCNFMVEYLKYFRYRSPYFSVFYNSLPVSGRDGTMESYGKKSVIAGKVHAKTGSMTRVKNLAGYIDTRSGKTVAFCFMANNYTCGGAKVKSLQEEILRLIYEMY